MRTLKWGGSPHELRIYQVADHIKVDLRISKDGGHQTCVATAHMNVVDFMQAWSYQGSAWKQVHEKDTTDQNGNYFAIRVVEIVNYGTFVWTVDHRRGVPGDDLSFIEGVSAADLEKAYAKE